MGKEYLVEGAELICVNGKGIKKLKIEEKRGCTENGNEKANCKDCVAEKNIPYFDYCKKNTKDHKCKGYMKLAGKWENTEGLSFSREKINGEEAITMSSVLVCEKGGLILPVTSGQGGREMLDMGLFGLRYLKAAGWAKGKGLGCQIFGWDPINLNTGNFIYEKEDLVIPGITTLSFHIFYNSMDEEGGSLGKGWHHSHEVRIRRKEKELLAVCLGDGKEIPFRSLTSGLYAPVLGDKGLLAEDKEGFRYAGSDGVEYSFNKEGQLLCKKDKNGNKDTCTYNAKGQLASVKGANGGELFFTYNKERNLIGVKDHTGREVRLWYRYGKLWKFVNASGHAYTYEYNVNGRLESVLTPRGIVGVKNEYDAGNRVVKQTMPDGSVVELKYDDKNRRTYVKEPDGNLVSYESDDRCRNTKTVYGDGEESFRYNDKNQRILYTDKNGSQTRYRYDENGNLTGIINALGEQTEFTYNKEGKLLTAAAGGKVRIRNRYDEGGRLAETEDALGRCRKTAYGSKGLPACLTLPDGSVTRLLRDERGNIEKIIDPYGGETSYVYDELNRVTETTDAEGNTARYRYDERNRLLEVMNAEGNTRAYAYNESGKPVQMKDFDGGILSVAYNVMGKPEKLTDKEGRETKRTYNEMGNISEEISPSGAVTCFSYDKNSRLARVEVKTGREEGEGGCVITYAHDPEGNLVKVQAGDGREVLSETCFVYDALNRVTEAVSPSGGRTVYTYDASGHVDSITDPAGNRRSFSYNEAGELMEETDIRGNTTRYEYNLLGQPVSITDGAGRQTRHFYLPGGRLKNTVYPDGRKISYTYDRLGRILTKTDGQGYQLSYGYDSMGRVISVTSSTGQKKSYTYDALGNAASMTDANGNTTVYEYTLSGRLKAVTDALGGRAEYAYDKEDRLVYICRKGKAGEEERETFYERNPLGQVECIRDALGNEEHFSYDALGRTIGKTDRDGYHTAYSYTPDGKVKDISYGDGTGVEMEYTALRQLACVRDWLGETRIERDEAGNPLRITDHKGRCVSYEWGAMGERKSIAYPDGRKVRYQYDGLLRLKGMQMKRETGIKAGGFEEIRYRYDETGRVSEKLFPDGMRTCWLYDERGLLKELVHKDSHGILDRYRYEYDPMGNKTAVTKERRGLSEEAGRYEYGYDALSRLSQVSRNGEMLRSYEYDSFSNRSCLKDFGKGKNCFYHYDVLNRLTAAEELQGEATVQKAYAYDGRGNLIREETDGNLFHGYEYGAMNRLTGAWDNKGKKAEYFYNGLGQRVGRTVSTGNDSVINNAINAVSSVYSADGEEEDYILDLTRPYHNLLEIRKGSHCQSFFFDGGVAAMEEDGGSFASAAGSERRCLPGLHYYLHDELGSPMRVSGYRAESGSFAGISDYLTYGYDEFGNDLGKVPEETGIPNPYDRQGAEQPFGYTGYRYDGISGSYFAQAREYKPEAGRFTAEDVIKGNGAVPMTLNQYGYCWGNPLIWVDLNGLWPAWLEGIYAHIQFQFEFLVLYDEEYGVFKGEDKYGDINVSIHGGGRYGGLGYADMVLYNGKDVEIYEIKPQSHYVDESKRTEGEDQLQRYIKAYGTGKGATEGKMEDIGIILFWEEDFIFDPDKRIVYRMYEDSPGMIYYETEYKNKKKQKAAEKLKVFQPQFELDEDMEKGLLVMIMAGITGVAALGEMAELYINRSVPIIIDEKTFKIMMEAFNNQLTGKVCEV